MTPDIGLYAPFIQAVFSLPKDNPRWMPFSIADRGLRQSSILADHFLSLLDLAGGRLGASQVFDFLESPPVRDRFGLSEDDLEVIRNWIETSGIRWGLDAESCAALKLPVDSQNTWRNGLDRMLLGYAMPGTESDRLYMGLLPYGGIEGSDTLILERFLSFTERLFAALGDLSSPRDAALWPESLLSVLDAFFAVEHEAYERDAQAVRSILNALADEVSKSHFTGMIPLEVIKAWLSGRLERHSVGHGFLSGGVTFCAMLPMRSIPFKVICLVGMNDGAYPRESPALAFDLIARHPRPGDRSRRQDDPLSLSGSDPLCPPVSLYQLRGTIGRRQQHPPPVSPGERTPGLRRGMFRAGRSCCPRCHRHPPCPSGFQSRLFHREEPAFQLF